MIKVGIVMDSIFSIDIEKDSSFALILEAQSRNYEIYYMEIHHLFVSKGKPFAYTSLLSVNKNKKPWYNFYEKRIISLKNLDVILMRKDPPFNINFIYVTYILELAESEGVLVINKPKSLRDCNEKVFINWFPECIADTLVSCNIEKIYKFYKKHKTIVLKPLDKMGGKSVFLIRRNDPNFYVIAEHLTKFGKHFCMAQKYLSDIKNGDKRILIVDGNPVPYCLARIPKKYEIRGNLSAGGTGEVRKISKNDLKIVKKLSYQLKKRGLIFVGVDIIGNYLTEINITSPTCLQEIEKCSKISISGMLFDIIEKRLLKTNS